jgi:hypothetical protein
MKPCRVSHIQGLHQGQASTLQKQCRTATPHSVAPLVVYDTNAQAQKGQQFISCPMQLPSCWNSQLLFAPIATTPPAQLLIIPGLTHRPKRQWEAVGVSGITIVNNPTTTHSMHFSVLIQDSTQRATQRAPTCSLRGSPPSIPNPAMNFKVSLQYVHCPGYKPGNPGSPTTTPCQVTRGYRCLHSIQYQRPYSCQSVVQSGGGAASLLTLLLSLRGEVEGVSGVLGPDLGALVPPSGVDVTEGGPAVLSSWSLGLLSDLLMVLLVP